MCGTRSTFASKGPQVVKWFAGQAPVRPNDVQWISGAEFKRAFPSEARGFDYDSMKMQPISDSRTYALGAVGSSVRPITRRVIFVDTDKPTKCGAMCRNAKGPMCDCSCKGENHGASVAMSRARFAASDLDLKPTQQMADNAARGLELREKHGKGGTAVGVARARDIKNRANLSPETVKRMHAFFSRHEGNQAGGEDDAGYIAWMLWGGDAGKSWAARKAAQIDKNESARRAAKKATMANQTNDTFTVQLRWNGMGAPQHRVAFKTLAEAEKEAERLHRLYGSLGNPEFPTMKGIVEIEVHDTKQPWKNRTVRWFASRPGGKAKFDRNIIVETWTSPKGTRYEAGLWQSHVGRFQPYVSATYSDGGEQLMTLNEKSYATESKSRKRLAEIVARMKSHYSRPGKAAFSNGERNRRMMQVLADADRRIANQVVSNIAAHYGIPTQQVFDEIFDAGAENLMDYVTEPVRSAASVILQKKGMMSRPGAKAKMGRTEEEYREDIGNAIGLLKTWTKSLDAALLAGNYREAQNIIAQISRTAQQVQAELKNPVQRLSRPGKAAFAANNVDLWNFLSRNDTSIARQNKNDLALLKKYAQKALTLPDFTPPSLAQHGPSLHTMAKDVLAEIKAWEEQAYRYRNRAPWNASRPGATAFAFDPFTAPALPAEWGGKRITLAGKQYKVEQGSNGYDLFDLTTGKKAKTMTGDQLESAWSKGRIRDIFGVVSPYVDANTRAAFLRFLDRAATAAAKGDANLARDYYQQATRIMSATPALNIAGSDSRERYLDVGKRITRIPMSRPGAKGRFDLRAKVEKMKSMVSKLAATLGFKPDEVTGNDQMMHILFENQPKQAERLAAALRTNLARVGVPGSAITADEHHYADDDTTYGGVWIDLNALANASGKMSRPGAKAWFNKPKTVTVQTLLSGTGGSGGLFKVVGYDENGREYEYGLFAMRSMAEDKAKQIARYKDWSFRASRPGAKAEFGTNKRIVRYAGHEFLAEDEGDRTRISIKVDGAWEHATTVNTANQTATEWIEANARPGDPRRWLPYAFSRPGAKAKFGTTDEALKVFETLAEAEKASMNGNRVKLQALLKSIAPMIARDRAKLPAGAVAFYDELVAKAAMSRPGEAEAFAIGATSDSADPAKDEALTALAAKVGREHTVNLFKRWSEGKASMSRSEEN